MVILNLGDKEQIIIEKAGVLVYDEESKTEKLITDEEYKNAKDSRHIKLITRIPIHKVVTKEEFESVWKDKGYKNG